MNIYVFFREYFLCNVNVFKGDVFMGKNKSEDSKTQSAIDNSENSKNAKNGYMNVGNSSKYAAKQGTRNKN